MKYYLPDTTTVIVEESSTTLCIGTLHRDEVSISHSTSTPQFLEKLEELMRTKKLLLDKDDDDAKDFDTLVSLNMLRKTDGNKAKNPRHLTIVSKTLPPRIMNLLKASNQEVMPFEEIFNDSFKEKVLHDRGLPSDTYDNALLKKACQQYQNFHVIAPLSELLRLRAFNRSMKYYAMPFTLSLVDNHHTYFMSVKHGYTGCFECLERHIISRFAGTVEEYAKQTRIISYKESDFIGEDLYLVGTLIREINNIDSQQVTTLFGNVAYFNFMNYEYSFDVNHVQSCCPTCATLNNI